MSKEVLKIQKKSKNSVKNPQKLKNPKEILIIPRQKSQDFRRNPKIPQNPRKIPKISISQKIPISYVILKIVFFSNRIFTQTHTLSGKSLALDAYIYESIDAVVHCYSPGFFFYKRTGGFPPADRVPLQKGRILSFPSSFARYLSHPPGKSQIASLSSSTPLSLEKPVPHGEVKTLLQHHANFLKIWCGLGL